MAEYFNPIGSINGGTSRKPQRSGAPYESINSGAVPEEDGVALGSGRQSFSIERGPSPPTKVVADWLFRDKKAREYWLKQAKDQRESARWSKEVKENQSTIEKVSLRKLTGQLREEITREIPVKNEGLYREMLFAVIWQVNWGEIAEDLLEP